MLDFDKYCPLCQEKWITTYEHTLSGIRHRCPNFDRCRLDFFDKKNYLRKSFDCDIEIWWDLNGVCEYTSKEDCPVIYHRIPILPYDITGERIKQLMAFI